MTAPDPAGAAPDPAGAAPDPASAAPDPAGTTDRPAATNIADGWEDRRPTERTTAVLDWWEVLRRFDSAQLFWLTTADGTLPHTRPVLAAVVDGRPCIATSPAARKARLLGRNPSVSLAASTTGMDVVVEGRAQRITDPSVLERVAATYRSKYGWPASVEGRSLTAPSGAPTAGPPPYDVYGIEPATAFAFGTTDTDGPRSTRWRFDGAGDNGTVGGPDRS